MINIDPKSWHARLYLWYLRDSGSMLARRALQGTYLCPYMRTLLIWIPLYVTLGLPFRFVVTSFYRFVVRPLYLLLWGGSEWHFRPRWIWLGALIGAPLLVPPTWIWHKGWAWWSGVAWEFGFFYVMMVIAIAVAVLVLLLMWGLANLIELRGGKQAILQDIKTVRGVARFVAQPVTRPTYGFARLLHKYYQTFHTKMCPRIQFMQPEAWEEE